MINNKLWNFTLLSMKKKKFQTPKRPDTTRWSGVNDSLKSFIDMI